MASVYFDTNNESLYAETNLITSAISYTMMGWCKLAVLDQGGDKYLLQNTDALGTKHHIIWLNASSQVCFSADGASTYAIPASQPTATSWFCWAITVNGSGVGNAKLWLRADGGGSWVTDTAVASDYTFTAHRLGVPGSTFTPTSYVRYWRMWDAVLDETALNAEFTRNAPYRTANLLRDCRLAGSAAATTDSYNGYNLTLDGTLGTDGDDPTSPGGVVKYLKFLTQPAAVGQTVQGVVFESPTASPETTDIVGAKIGEFTGASVAAGTGDDTGKGVVLVDVADFGGGALAADEVVIALVRNATDGTGLESGVIVEI